MEKVDKCCYVQRILDEEESAIFWFDIGSSGATLFSMIRTPGKCIRADLVGLPTSLSNQQFLEVLAELKERAIERMGKRLVLLPAITRPYDEWLKRLPAASGQEKVQLQRRITHVESWINAYYSGLIDHNQEEMMLACNKLGIAYRDLGELPAAIACAQQTLSLAIQLNRHDGIGAAYGSLGNAYDFLGQYTRAIEFHNKHLAIKKNLAIDMAKQLPTATWAMFTIPSDNTLRRSSISTDFLLSPLRSVTDMTKERPTATWATLTVP